MSSFLHFQLNFYFRLVILDVFVCVDLVQWMDGFLRLGKIIWKYNMAEGTYEYECMRAELLGIEAPDYEEFVKNKREKEAAAEEDVENENLKDVEHEEEGIKRISGGLDELNSILQVTQRKINRFKASCGSLTNLLKIKIGQGPSTDLDPSTSTSSETPAPAPTANGTTSMPEGPRKSDLAKALDNHVDRLDSLIDKAENAQYSMAHQNKEMKRFLN